VEEKGRRFLDGITTEKRKEDGQNSKEVGEDWLNSKRRREAGE
jgi:hypothetical protein